MSTLPLGTPAAATVTIREPAKADEVIAVPNGMTLFEFVKSLIAERDRYRDVLLSRHGGECIALLDELDAARAALVVAQDAAQSARVAALLEAAEIAGRYVCFGQAAGTIKQAIRAAINQPKP